ncbi:MAG TPA: hypothetical protein VMP67_11405 [Candidatus Limnocylindria bacterium]|nr:hypothetical protein [Candidatus Limnocylindria bacterium]
MTASDPCQEAERLVELHRLDEQRLREARRRLNAMSTDFEQSMPVTDRSQLAAAKAQAQREYRQAYREATDQAAVQRAASVWLQEVSRLNRAAGLAANRGENAVGQLNALESKVRRLELEVDASRIRAEGARERCNEARRSAAAAAERQAGAGPWPVARPGPQAGGGEPAIAALLHGDRSVLEGVAATLADETGMEAGRLQLLIIELCEEIAASALDAAAIRFPDGHEFWDHFEPQEAHDLAATLGQLGYRFDGRAGWLDERVPHPRQFAFALAHNGLDSRVRRLPTQAQIEGLWRGAQLETPQHLARRAPDLSLEQIQTMLGSRGAALDELWENWAHVRRALVS